MSAPKSVVKVNKNGVTYTSNVDAANYYIFELTRAALRDVAKYVKKMYRVAYYQKFKRHKGKGPKQLTAKVLASKSTKYPRVEIGMPALFYAYWQEKGSVKQKAEWTLKTTVESNIGQIREIEAQYLSGIDDGAELPGEDDILIEDDD